MTQPALTSTSTSTPACPCPYPLATIYGVLLNDPAELAHYGAALHAAPYGAPPAATVLHIKTSNTLNASPAVPLPADCPALEIGATLGMVIRRSTPLAAQHSRSASASDVAGVLLMIDWCVPHDTVYRPPIKYRNRDGFLGLGGFIACPPECNLDAWIAGIRVSVSINQRTVQTIQFTQMQRSATALLASVSEQFSLRGDAHAASDVLMLGLAWNHAQPRPQARWDDCVELTAVHYGSGETLATLTQTVVAEADWQPERCFAGANANPTVFCLGLNYADHAKELAFKPPSEPLVFLKSKASFTKNQAAVPRPAGVQMMHYECELAVVIGKTAKNVARAEAYDYVSGYTVANDFAVRDYLENYYRPNLRVKNRDRCTPFLEPATPASPQLDPMSLTITTHVNGVRTQSGSTADMVFDIPTLIEYLSAIMTLSPGDLILTGTPDGVVDCKVGDEVRCEISGLGALTCTMN